MQKIMSRIVTGIEEFDKKRKKIFIDHQFAFVLYKGELRQYQIQEGSEITDTVYEQIMEEVLCIRAKKRCLNLLQKRPYTEQKLREKLREGFYPSEIEEKAIAYVKAFHYVDDYDYACQYIFYHKESETRRKMEEKLRLRGIGRETLQQAFEDSYEDVQEEIEVEQALMWIRKKKFDVQTTDQKEKRRIYSFFMRKGFRTSVIQKVMALQDIV